jgi:hypothetical protein
MPDLSSLTPEVRALVEEALADRQPGSKRVADLFSQALRAVGYPAGDHWRPLYPTPASLTPSQHAVVHALADPRFPAIGGFELPSNPHGVRRWLDGAGVLEKAVVSVESGGQASEEPLWRALQIKQLDGDGLRGVASVLNALPFATALEALGELLTWGGGGPRYKLNLTDLFASGELRLVRDLGDEGGSWALRVATERAWTPPEIGALGPFVFLALARARVPIDATLEMFFPHPNAVKTFRWKKPASPAYPRFGAEDYLELVAALPEARRDSVLTQGKWPLIYYAPDEWRLGILERYPSAVLARALLDAHQREIVELCMRPDRYEGWLKALRKLGEKFPLLLEAVEASLGSRVKPLELVVLSRRVVQTAAGLEAIERAQILAAGMLWDGKRLPPETRLGEEGASEPPPDDDGNPPVWGRAEFRKIGNLAGTHLYDVLLYANFYGAIFKAGSSKDIGYLADQQGVVLHEENGALLMGLREVVYPNPKVLEKPAGEPPTTRSAKRKAKKAPEKARPNKAAPAKKAGPKKKR